MFPLVARFMNELALVLPVTRDEGSAAAADGVATAGAAAAESGAATGAGARCGDCCCMASPASLLMTK